MKEELAELMAMNRRQLVKRWKALFSCPAPRGCHAEFIRQVIGWRIQAQHQGDLTVRERRKVKVGDAQTLSPGTHLVRVWQGETHQVTVLDKGYLYAGRHWRSLSAISRAISGTPWSGPVFFGLKK